MDCIPERPNATTPCAATPDAAIEHLPQRQRLQMVVDGLPCVADYRIVDGELWITHTGVPAELRGRGLAGRLVQAAVDLAHARGLQVVPVCSYAAAYLGRTAGAAPQQS